MKQELKNSLNHNFLTITYDAENCWVYNNWYGSQTLESVMQGAEACLKVLADHKCAYLLNDNRLVAGPWSQATEWIVTDWTPRAVATGLTHFAHVISPESLARLSAENMHHRIRGAFQMQIFEEAYKAEEWLKQARQKSLLEKDKN